MSVGQNAFNHMANDKLNCAASMLMGINEHYNLGLSTKEVRLITGFQGGTATGHFCGRIAGCVRALGYMFLDETQVQTPEFRALLGEFMTLCEKEVGFVNCRDIKPEYAEKYGSCAHLALKVGDLFQNFVDEKKAM